MVILSRMDGRKNNSIENMSRLKSYGGINLDATLAKILALTFYILGIGEIWNVIKCEVRF